MAIYEMPPLFIIIGPRFSVMNHCSTFIKSTSNKETLDHAQANGVTVLDKFINHIDRTCFLFG